MRIFKMNDKKLLIKKRKQDYLLEKHEDAFIITVFGGDERVSYSLATSVKLGRCANINIFLYNKLRRALKLFQMMSFNYSENEVQKYAQSQLSDLEKDEKIILQDIIRNWYDNEILKISMEKNMLMYKYKEITLKQYLNNLSNRKKIC